MHSLDKNLIKERFEKNLSTYTDNAVVQKHMASELSAGLITNCGKSFGKILEIGCGTGALTKEILSQFDFNELFVNDIVENSLSTEITSDKIKELYGDCEQIALPQSLDLVISNATFQWLQNLPAVLDKIHTSLNPNGFLAFSTFEEWNLYQISSLTKKTLDYYTKSDLEEILKQKYKIISSHSQTLELEFDRAQDVLKHLKLTGVNSLGTSVWTKSDLQNFSEKYKHLFRNEKGKLILTYKPVWFICGKIDMIVDEA